MNDPKSSTAAISASVAEALKKPRSVSGTGFPSFDLESSTKVAEAIHTKGGGAAAPDQIALWLGYSTTNSGTYNTRIAAAKQFGLIEAVPGGLGITDRGRTILAPIMEEDRVNASVEAFLGVDLFAKIYEQFYGKSLPPETGLKNLFQQTYKILPDRSAQAVRVFLNSAEQAGFFRMAGGERTRLVKPTSHVPPKSATDAERKDEPPLPQPPPVRAHSEGPTGVHSAITGLLRDLPAPGTMWSPKKKQRFMDAFKAAIDHIYPEDDDQ